jgi:hypothetical protein
LLSGSRGKRRRSAGLVRGHRNDEVGCRDRGGVRGPPSEKEEKDLTLLL